MISVLVSDIKSGKEFSIHLLKRPWASHYIYSLILSIYRKPYHSFPSHLNVLPLQRMECRAYYTPFSEAHVSFSIGQKKWHKKFQNGAKSFMKSHITAIAWNIFLTLAWWYPCLYWTILTIKFTGTFYGYNILSLRMLVFFRVRKKFTTKKVVCKPVTMKSSSKFDS